MSIVMDRVSKSFGERRVLREVSLALPDAGAVCLMAPSGAGKTTLARILLGLETPDAGTVAGVPARTAAVFQEDRLCERLTVCKNIRIACPRLSPQAVQAHLDEVGLSEYLRAPAGKLSGGQKRRAAIVRAVAADPAFLVLDEPFTGLDEETHARVIEYLRARTAGRSVLLITHDPRDAEALGAKTMALSAE